MNRQRWGGVVYFILILKVCVSCPNSCICKWRNGKQTVECINKGLLVIPEGMDPETQVLEFSGNNLQTLHKDKFLKMDLINLQRIYLSRCRIAAIDDRTFKGLTNLVELDLSDNLLEIVPTEAFVDCPSLMRLTLNSNPIRTLKRAAFNHLPYLNTLELRNCEISKVDVEAFTGLNSLEWLYLDGNKLTAIKASAVMSNTLKGVQLQENPWECDCHAIDLNSWLQDFNIPQNMQPLCNGPTKFQRRTVKSIPALDLACLPDVAPTTLYLEIGEGKNVSLLCHVNSVPEARVSWWFQGHILQNDSLVAPGMRLLYYLEDGVHEKRSELFIYNTTADDNGTFICTAENSAGISQANFTIRITIKHEQKIIKAFVVPLELMFIIVLAAAMVVILISTLFVYVIKKIFNKRERAMLQRDGNKSSLDNSTKDMLFPECSEEYSDASKESNIAQSEQILFCGDIKVLTSGAVNSARSPLSLHRYPLERNPDLINDTGTVERRHNGDGGNDQMYTPGVFNETLENLELVLHGTIKTPTILRKSARDLYRLSADVHLNPVGLLNTGAGTRPQYNSNCYKTLPYNRAAKRQSANNLTIRCTREAEFLSQTNQLAAYEHYFPDVRYTVDGYPVRNTYPELQIESSLQCTEAPVQWPSCLPVHTHNTNIEQQQQQQQQQQHKVITTKSVGAQTQTDNNQSPILNTKLSKSSSKINIVTDSLDEGYEGER